MYIRCNILIFDSFAQQTKESYYMSENTQLQEQLYAQLQQLFEQTTIDVATCEAVCLPKVQTTIWATAPLFHLEALKIERARLSKGKRLKAMPEPKASCVKIGLNAAGQLVYEEHWDGTGQCAAQKYVVRDKTTVYAYIFDRTEQLQEIEQQVFDGEQLIQYGSYAPLKANTIDTYYYENDQLIAIQTLWVYHKIIQRPYYTIQYDTLGKLDAIIREDASSDIFPQGQHIRVFKKTNYSIAALKRLFIKAMVPHLVDQIAAASEVNYLLISIQSAFAADQWLPPNCYFLQLKELPTSEMSLNDCLAKAKLKGIPMDKSSQLLAIANLFQQELELKEQYTLVEQLPQKIGKALVKELQATSSPEPVESNLKVLVANLPDDLEEKMLSLLQLVYPKRMVKKWF